MTSRFKDRLRIVWLDRACSDSATLLQGINALVDGSFDPASYRSSYPLVFGPTPTADICVALLEQKVVGCVAMLPVTLQYRMMASDALSLKSRDSRLVRFACLGSVCVAEDHRKQGIAESMMQWVCADLAHKQFDAAGLFAADGRLYKKLSFVPAQADGLVLCSALATLLGGGDVRGGVGGGAQSSHQAPQLQLHLRRSTEMPEQWCRRLWYLACRSLTSGSYQPVLDYRQFSTALCNTPMHILTAWTGTNSTDDSLRFEDRPSENLVGALCYEKGGDFKETWHGALASRDERLPVLAALIKKAAALYPASQLLLDDLTTPLCLNVVGRTAIHSSPSFMTKRLEPCPSGCSYKELEGTRDADLFSLAIPSLLSI